MKKHMISNEHLAIKLAIYYISINFVYHYGQQQLECLMIFDMCQHHETMLCNAQRAECYNYPQRQRE